MPVSKINQPIGIFLYTSKSAKNIMIGKKINTWGAKAKRTMTSFLPISKDRRGKCLRCGECCKLPNRCIFLRIGKDKKAVCTIRPFRSLNCRKYPRTKSEHITKKTCGFYFK